MSTYIESPLYGSVLHTLKHIENSFSILTGRKELGTTSELNDNCYVALSVFQNNGLFFAKLKTVVYVYVTRAKLSLKSHGHFFDKFVSNK